MFAQLADLARGHLLAIAFTAYALGVLIVTGHVPIGLVAACAASALFATLAVPRAKAFVSLVAPTVAATAIACAIFGVVAGYVAERNRARTDQELSLLDGRHVICLAEALERARPSANGASLRVRILAVSNTALAGFQAVRGRVALLKLPAESAIAGIAGQRLRVAGRLDIPLGPRNEGEPAERDQLADQGVSVILTVHRPRDLRALGPSHTWSGWWARTRTRFAEAVESRLPPMPATVLEGVLWGDRGNLPATLRQEFSDTGTVHVLTTAGLHLGIMAALVAVLLAQFPLPRTVRAVAVIAAAWAYAALAGLHLPTLRAATMLSVGVIAFESGRARTASAVLAAAAFAVTLPHPLALLSPSFSMSFACVAGIALLSPPLASLGVRAGVWGPHWLAELVRTGVSVQLALAPLQALYFNAFTPYAVAANLVVVPMVGLVMATGTAYAVAVLIAPALAWPLSNLTWWCLTFMIGAVERFAALPAAHIDVPPPTHAFVICYWIALGALALAAHRQLSLGRMLAGAVAGLVLLAFVYCIPGIAAMFDRHLYLDAIDVGQADCLLLRAPGWHAMLVDGGGKLERAGGAVVAQPIGDRIAVRTVLPFLLRHWVLHLDAVVLTHPHGDHVGGLPVILSRERVDTLWDSAQLYGGPAYRRALDVVRERHIAWRRALRGESFDLGPQARVRILAPELPLITGTTSDINNNSVVLRVEFGRTAILLTGDAQAEAEARLLSHGGADLRADVLKVGHHGSAYSSTPAFLAAVRPNIAIISCGRHNVFGHPSPRTLKTLAAAGARVFRTDVDGGVEVLSNGVNETVATMR